MSDEQSQDTSVNTEVADTSAEDTSVNEDTQEDDVDLEDSDISFEDADDEDESEASDETEAATEESEQVEEESEADEDAEPDEQPDTPVNDKEQARLAYEQRQAEKQAREAREQAKREAQAQYLQGAEDDKDLALRQLQIDAYNNKITNNTEKLGNTLDRAIADIKYFKEGTPAVQNRLLKALDTFEDLYVVKDRNGDPIEIRGDLYQYLRDEASDIEQLLGDGATQQEKSKQSQKSRTLTPPVKTPKKPKVDQDLLDFDEEFKRWS